MFDTKPSYRTVPMVPIDTMSAAAHYVAREWGEHGYRIGYAGSTPSDDGSRFYWFQVCASDGSRFLVYSDRWGNVGTPADRDEELALSARLDVEVS